MGGKKLKGGEERTGDKKGDWEETGGKERVMGERKRVEQREWGGKRGKWNKKGKKERETVIE